jgi:hypothetical protein
MLSVQGNGPPSKVEVFDYEDDDEDVPDESISIDEMKLDSSSDEDNEPVKLPRRRRSLKRVSEISLGDDSLSEEDSDYPAPQRQTAASITRRRGSNSGPVTRRRNRANKLGIPLTQEEKDRRARLAYLRLHAWAPAPAFIPNTSTGAWDQAKGVKKRTPLTQEKKDKRAQLAITRLHAWAPAPTFLPNPKTGAWDKKPVTRHFKRRTRLPEPITFLQAPSGAWSQRAYGHGVEPIFSRPARRADGNPGQQTYLQRLENGFRPVVVLRKGRRQLLPTVPSKVLLRNLKESPSETSDSELQQSIEPVEVTRKRRRPRKIVEDSGDEKSIKISKKTGLPVRKYVRNQPDQRPESMRRRSTLSRVEPLNYSWESSPEPASVRRSGRMPKATIKSMNEIDLLSFIEPPAVKVRAKPNPGLKTLPATFFLDSPEDRGFAPEYWNLKFSDPKSASDDCDMTDGSWMYDGWQIPTPVTFKVKWEEENDFTIKTLPYHELERESEEIHTDKTAEPRQKKQRREAVVPVDQDLSQYIFDTTRAQTALLEDFEHVLLDPKEASTTLGVEVSSQGLRTRSKHGIKTKATSTAFDTRFVVAVVVIRTLTGGLEGLIDWVILSKLFPDYSISFLTISWRKLSKNHASRVDELVGEFQGAFLSAYQKVEVPAINFDNLMNYNWDALINWVLSTLSPSLDSRSIALPPSRSELETDYTIAEPVDNDPNNWRATYFSRPGPAAPMYKRLAVACSIPSSLPIHKAKSATSTSNIDVAKSWVRAIALTPEADWNQNQSLARTKLTSLGQAVVEKAVTELKEEKVIHHRAKGRASLGRSYEVMDAFLSPLRKSIAASQFASACNFKMYLDEQFAVGHERVRVDYLTDEGAMMCITSLQASRRIRLVDVNVPMNKFGLCENGNYETKNIPKEKFRFDVDILPTASYTFSTSLPCLDLPPPGPSPDGELPVWLGIGGQVILELWRRVVAAVAQTLALRAGVTVQGLAKALSPTIGEWEVRSVMEWGVRVGMFERLHPRIEGWTVGEWWWAFVGRVCEGGEGMIV